MKKTLFAAVVVVAAATGCNQSPPGGNTPASNSSDAKSNLTAGKDTFSISAPMLAKDIKQGDKETVTLSVKRGSEFKQPVKLSVDVPKGLKAELSKPAVAMGDPDDVMLSIMVDKDAPLGDSTITVKGTPDSGTATSVGVKVKVEQGPKS